MTFSSVYTKEYKLSKLRITVLEFSTVLCILTMTGLGFVLMSGGEAENIWQKVGIAIMTVFVALIWIGMSYTFLINNDKCTNCRISIKDDYKYCDECNLQKEIELRNTTETLCCLVCDAEIESFDAFKDH